MSFDHLNLDPPYFTEAYGGYVGTDTALRDETDVSYVATAVTFATEESRYQLATTGRPAPAPGAGSLEFPSGVPITGWDLRARVKHVTHVPGNGVSMWTVSGGSALSQFALSDPYHVGADWVDYVVEYPYSYHINEIINCDYVVLICGGAAGPYVNLEYWISELYIDVHYTL